jgi:ElaB/YqjD/DUF883 family membrane-anchored ribosome-binding protein
MKNKSLIIATTAVALVLGAVGCKKETVTKTEDTTKQAAASAVDAVKAGAETAVDKTKEVAAQAVDKAKEGAEAVKAGAEKAVEAVKTEAQAITAPSSDKAQGIIDQAKSLVDGGKYQEALTALGGLSGMTLSDAQQKIVDGLKEQIQKAISGAAAAKGAGAVGNLLK